MPGYDKTGPMGRGPMTGRGAGYCRPGEDEDRPRDYGRPFFGRGRGPFGRGRGGWAFYRRDPAQEEQAKPEQYTPREEQERYRPGPGWFGRGRGRFFRGRRGQAGGFGFGGGSIDDRFED